MKKGEFQVVTLAEHKNKTETIKFQHKTDCSIVMALSHDGVFGLAVVCSVPLGRAVASYSQL